MTDQIREVWGTILSWIPDILAALLILLIGYIIARLLKSLVEGVLKRINFNERIFRYRETNLLKRVTDNPTGFVGGIIYWLVWIVVITIAIPILNIPFLNELIFQFYAYIPKIIAAILIFGIAVVLASGVNIFVNRIMGETSTGKVVSSVVPSLIMTIAVFMVLVQLGIATSIVIITYTALVGALALGFSLAFGLGGREVAGKILDEAYNKSRKNWDRVREDLRTGKEKGMAEADRVKKR